MKKKVFIVRLAVFLCGACCFCDGRVKKIPVEKNSTIVCFGDSLTFGHGAEDQGISYPKCIQEKVNVPVINSGVNDDTTADGIKRFKTDVLDHNPAIVIFDFGGNDVWYPKKRIAGKQIEENFRMMFDQIDFSKTQVYVLRYYNDHMRFLDFFHSFDRMLERLEKDYDIIVIRDIWKGVWGNKNLKYDMSHPNADGYKIIAQNIYAELEPCLELNGLKK
ncbi:MAG: hypothetical protein KBT11_11380 [Treponema sp.]|nr:hypothetical protein [Candidatus Treponema equifaecale]